MNLAQLKATLTRNGKPLAIAGAAGVAGLAWWSSRRKTTTTSAGYPADSSAAPSYYTPGSAGTYDSGAADTYNALQPQIESLSGRLSDLAGLIPVPAEPAVPEPDTTAPAVPGYLQTTDPRRQAIITNYREILGRTDNIGLSEINFWDRQPFDLAGIRQRFLRSTEAQGQ
jgi:hypothetical protein